MADSTPPTSSVSPNATAGSTSMSQNVAECHTPKTSSDVPAGDAGHNSDENKRLPCADLSAATPQVAHLRHSPPPPLEPRQAKALSLLLEGLPETRIAEAVGVDRQTIYRWKKLPAFAAALDAHSRRLRREAGLKLGAVACKAVSVLEGQLENPNSDVRYRAAALILKAALGRAPNPAAHADEVDTNGQQ